MLRATILADLAGRYPDGYMSFSTGGKRLAEPELIRCATGCRTKINGAWHLYDGNGRYIGSGSDNAWRVALLNGAVLLPI